MSSEAIVRASANPLEALSRQIEGLDAIKIRPSVLELVQRTTTKAEAQPGKFRDTQSNTHFDEMTVIPLRYFTNRVYFPPGGDLGAEPICKSDNGIYPSQFANVKQSDECATCPMRQWVNGKRPPCQEKRRLLFINRDTNLPYIMTISASSIKLLDNQMEHITKEILSLGGSVPYQLYDFSFKMKPTFVTDKKGSYYVITCSNTTRLSEQGQYGPFYDLFVRRANQPTPQLTQIEPTGTESLGEVVEPEYLP